MFKVTWLLRPWQGARAGDAARCRSSAGQRTAEKLSTGEAEQQGQSVHRGALPFCSECCSYADISVHMVRPYFRVRLKAVNARKNVVRSE